MLQEWGWNCEYEDTWHSWKAIADRTADLPGVNGRGSTQVYASAGSLSTPLRSYGRAHSSSLDEIRHPVATSGVRASASSVPGWPTTKSTFGRSEANLFTTESADSDVSLLAAAFQQARLNGLQQTYALLFPEFG
ncbi:uncharacterized protein FOMMEDRAFT_139484 [Fomitiporia mediterranea MF3/22]|uniref:uncharacterized protein n=1 Tax=Fomitiporia mediterranea (strain MF3/22) TaxID=694068 RepID=UPI0004408E5A|nr:uncharacterized protein FOMMEDRAFT_139484 [Fomitiporia mediterranea MF3/22]EJD04677.1 hypothetical protein FOMMEDRAFT_139484 [Fomitiporia mediterranea MF3/22]